MYLYVECESQENSEKYIQKNSAFTLIFCNYTPKELSPAPAFEYFGDVISFDTTYNTNR